MAAGEGFRPREDSRNSLFAHGMGILKPLCALYSPVSGLWEQAQASSVQFIKEAAVEKPICAS